MKTALYFVAALIVIALMQWVGAWVAGFFGLTAQHWLEFFVERDMSEVAILVAPLIFIGGLVGLIVVFNRLEDWWRDIKMRRPLV